MDLYLSHAGIGFDVRYAEVKEFTFGSGTLARVTHPVGIVSTFDAMCHLSVHIAPWFGHMGFLSPMTYMSV